MSALEDFAGKYLDEIKSFLPISALCSFASGICLISSIPAGGSAWFALLTRPYQDLWFFRDLLIGREVWQLLALAGMSLLGSSVVKAIARSLLVKGLKTTRVRISAVYKRASEIAAKGEFTKIEIEAAREWKTIRFSSVWSAYKAASFFCSIALISGFVFLTSFALADLLAFVFLILLAAWFSWKFSKRFFIAYLPERLLFDASLGLLEPRLFEDLNTQA